MASDEQFTSDVELGALFMSRALELAARGEGYVEPNPMVGCVIVRDGAVVGEGWHQKFGGPHAEIEALREGFRVRSGLHTAAEQAQGSGSLAARDSAWPARWSPRCARR